MQPQQLQLQHQLQQQRTFQSLNFKLCVAPTTAHIKLQQRPILNTQDCGKRFPFTDGTERTSNLKDRFGFVLVLVLVLGFDFKVRRFFRLFRFIKNF